MSLTLPPDGTAPRIVLFGNSCHFTAEFLLRTESRSMDVLALVLPGLRTMDEPVRVDKHHAPLLGMATQAGNRSITDIARRRDIPLYRVGNLASRQTRNLVKQLEADILLSVCFPRLIPDVTHASTTCLALNLHPSLLPRLRGPDPMFWTFKQGSGESGVTLHELSDRFDAGAIVAQQQHDYADGTTEAELESTLAEIGAGLIEGVALMLLTGSVSRRPQNESDSSYAPFPEEMDYRIEPTASPRAAFNFVQGIGQRGTPVSLNHGDKLVQIRRANGYIDTGGRTVGEERGTCIEMNGGSLFADIDVVEPLRRHSLPR